MLTKSEQTATESTTERTQSLANPRRTRIGRDGRPLPLPQTDED